jgi:hypothetical protein
MHGWGLGETNVLDKNNACRDQGEGQEGVRDGVNVEETHTLDTGKLQDSEKAR